MKIDQNGDYVVMGFDGTNAVPLKIDPVTGELLITIIAESLPHTDGTTKFDQNGDSVSQVVDDNGVINPLLVSPSTSALLVDMM